ncbi:MAG: replicative DNA helicase [Rhodospirillaceae bacterium]|jgi:replicative DNA helicase|nr:replicative DNA helicase [Rhodospirillaceae bacterium]MBT7267536.1 replicative DNA helicase [Rhodospirillaceae bacterium]
MATAIQNPTNLQALPEDDQSLPSFRSPPHNFEAEKALLGAIFANNNAYDRVSGYLQPEHFAEPIHGNIYGAISKLLERGQIADPITLRTYFEQNDALADVGGTRYLAEIAGSMVNVINAAEYGRLIYDLHLKRHLIELGEQVVNRAYSPEVDDNAMKQIENAEQTLYDLATTGEIEGGFQDFKSSVVSAVEMAEIAHKRDGHLSGVSTGMRDLDLIMGGLHPSDLIILAGRPSMGKTALATNIAFNAAYDYRVETDEQGNQKVTDGAVVGFFSLEMSAEQLAARILSEQAEIASDKMRRGTLTNDEFDKLVVASQQLHTLPIYIDDTPAMSVSMLRTRARRLKRNEGLGLIVVDYLQLMEGSSRTDNRVQEISEITRGLKTLAKELDVPVLALSQLSRAVEQREDKRPLLSDLRESGTIEQDADVVSFIYRQAYYDERSEPSQRPEESADKYATRYSDWEERREKNRFEAEVIIGKQRHGPTGTAKLHFNGMYTRFGDLDTQHTESY